MSFYVLSGPSLNHLSRSLTVPAFSPAADTNFPGTYAYDNRANLPAYWSASSSANSITVDLTLVANPGFEASLSTGWVASGTTGTLSQSDALSNTGTYSAKLATSTGGAYSYDIAARSGETMKFSYALYGGGSTTARAMLQMMNVETGSYLQSSGTSWGSASAYIVTNSSAAWAEGSATFTVEPVTTSLKELVTLRLYMCAESSGEVYFDDLEVVPGTNFCSVHGHNLTPIANPKFESSPDNSAWTTRATMTVRRDSFHSRLTAPLYIRYWRLLLDGTSTSVPYIGELVMGEAYALTVSPVYGGALDNMEAQVRVETGDGGEWVYARGQGPVRRLALSFIYDTDAAYQQAKDVFFRGSRGGLVPCVVAPEDMDSAVVIYGRIGERATYVKQDYRLRTATWEVIESPLPYVTYSLPATFGAPV